MYQEQFLNKTMDIKFTGQQVYHLKTHEWNTDKIEKEVSKLFYFGTNLPKDEKVENAKLPPFALHFFQIIFEIEEIPTVDCFLDSYIKQFFEKIDNEHIILKEIFKGSGLSEEKLNIESIKYRFIRTIPSLIRDFHFTFLLYEKSKYKNVYYSLKQDYFKGYDIVLKHDNKEFGISVYVKTKRGELFKKKKKNRHSYNTREEIEFSIDLNECKKVGEIYLLTVEHVNKLEKLIENGEGHE